MKLIIIGAGNVATRLSFAMEKVGMFVSQVYSHSESHARELGEKLYCSWTADIKEVNTDGDVYIFAVKDDALRDVILQMPKCKGLWVHTSGSMPIDVFRGRARNCGVLYPLQTLSKGRDVDFKKIPLFIEASNKKSEKELFEIALRLVEKFEANNDMVHFMSSEKRKYIHLAAVFACNFSNHMYAIASQILEKQDIDWHLLQPIINETAEKLYTLTPEEAQTGPAIRFDKSVIDKHLSLIEDSRSRDLYERISESIHEKANMKK